MLEIVDTVYLIAYLRANEARHEKALELLSGLGASRRISQAALLELDLLMKSRGFNPEEREKVWSFLEQLIPEDAVEVLLPADFLIAVRLHEEGGLDYFDALVAAQCILRGATPLTTDSDILRAVKEIKSQSSSKS